MDDLTRLNRSDPHEAVYTLTSSSPFCAASNTASARASPPTCPHLLDYYFLQADARVRCQVSLGDFHCERVRSVLGRHVLLKPHGDNLIFTESDKHALEALSRVIHLIIEQFRHKFQRVRPRQGRTGVPAKIQQTLDPDAALGVRRSDSRGKCAR